MHVWTVLHALWIAAVAAGPVPQISDADALRRNWNAHDSRSRSSPDQSPRIAQLAGPFGGVQFASVHGCVTNPEKCRPCLKDPQIKDLGERVDRVRATWPIHIRPSC